MSCLAAVRALPILLAALGPAAGANKVLKATDLPYTLVNCCDSRGMTVFPFDGTAFTVPLPFAPLAVRFSPKGNALYAIEPRGTDGRVGLGIVKIEFHPTRVNTVWESVDFEISSFAVSMGEDKLVMAARTRDRADKTCGLFEISLPSQKVRRILKSSDCGYEAVWTELSLSSDGGHAVANIGGDLDSIDLVHGTVKPLGSEFSGGKWRSGAAWSPDGKRIAVMESGSRGRVFLVDPSDLSRQRVLHGGYHRMTPVWSPDSRYLVRSRLQLRCGISFDIDPPFTLEIVDVESGKRSLIRSSTCKMEGGNTGWLRTDLIR